MYNHRCNNRFKNSWLLIGCWSVLLVGVAGCKQFNPKSVTQGQDASQLTPLTQGQDAGEAASVDPGGIPNMGNTCYLNSVLQIFAKLYPTAFAGENDPLSKAGQAIVNKIKKDQKNATREESQLVYKAFLTATKNNKRAIGQVEGKQEDVQEAFLFLFEKYIFDSHKHVALRGKKEKESKFYKHYIEQVKQNPYIEKQYSDTTKITLNSSKFKSVLRFDPIPGALQVSLEENTSEISMQDLLFKKYLAPEPIEEYNWHEITYSKKKLLNVLDKIIKRPLKKRYPDYNITSNGNNKEIVKGTAMLKSRFGKLEKLSNGILPIHALRFNPFETKKNDMAIQHPSQLVIKKEQTVKGTSDLNYELAGFISHLGATINSGHYVAYIKSNGKWKQYNDSRVTPANATEVNEAAGKAYLYFYKRAS